MKCKNVRSTPVSDAVADKNNEIAPVLTFIYRLVQLQWLMQCISGLCRRLVSVRPSVCQSGSSIV